MTSRPAWRARLAEARACTDALFALVRPDSFYERPIPARHRLIFYLGHVEAFDWNQLCQGALALPAFHPTFDRLFAFGIDPPEGQLPEDQPADWPAAEEVRRYNKRVRQVVDERLAEAPEDLLHVVREHRLMHAETLAYLLHQLPSERKMPPPGSPPVPDEAFPAEAGPAPDMIAIPAGSATLGRGREEAFGWDNEQKAHQVPVPAFAISKYKVTNGQYLAFVKAGAPPPYYWGRRGAHWGYRAMFQEVPLPLDWPVYVTHQEAQAYAQWAGKALPTEAEFHRAAYGTHGGEERRYPWGEAPPEARRGNFAFHRWDPLPVTATPAGESAFGVAQLVGNGWEWTATVFQPFPGFRPLAGYPGYSVPFFDGAHYVLKGASPRTAACLLRRSFRNWFRPRYPYVYAGFRCVDH